MRRRQLLHLLGLGFPVGWVSVSIPALAGRDDTSAVKSKALQVSGIRLHYLEWGSERAAPVVLLHPAPLNAHVWDHLGPILASQVHVIAPDARGFGARRCATITRDSVALDGECLERIPRQPSLK